MLERIITMFEEYSKKWENCNCYINIGFISSSKDYSYSDIDKMEKIDFAKVARIGFSAIFNGSMYDFTIIKKNQDKLESVIKHQITKGENDEVLFD